VLTLLLKKRSRKMERKRARKIRRSKRIITHSVVKEGKGWYLRGFWSEIGGW
jgi:hypothetical protein